MARPKEFDPEEVVEKAMQIFWRKGYKATSVSDLVEETGVNRASLYLAFGDKRSLFLRALRRYAATIVPSRAGILEAEGASLPQIRLYFEAVATDLAGPAGERGCLMVNSAVELATIDSGVSSQIGAHLKRLEKAFFTSLSQAAKKGEIPATSNLRALSRFLVSASQGLMVVGKSNPDRKALQDIVQATLEVLV